MTRGGSSDAGSSFVEVLVALAIVMLSLAVFLDVTGDGAAHVRHMEDKRIALALAQSQLAAAGIAYPLDAGPVNGTDGAFSWWMNAAPYRRGGSSAGGLWRVTVQVSRQDGGPMLAQLRSLRLAPSS